MNMVGISELPKTAGLLSATRGLRYVARSAAGGEAPLSADAVPLLALLTTAGMVKQGATRGMAPIFKPFPLLGPLAHYISSIRGGKHAARHYARMALQGHAAAGGKGYTYAKMFPRTYSARWILRDILTDRHTTMSLYKKRLTKLKAKGPLWNPELRRETNTIEEALRFPPSSMQSKGYGFKAAWTPWEKVQQIADKRRGRRHLMQALGLGGGLAAASGGALLAKEKGLFDTANRGSHEPR